MAAKKKTTGKRPTHAARRRAVENSLKEVKKAQKNLELKMQAHHLVVSSMFFPDDTPTPNKG